MVKLRSRRWLMVLFTLEQIHIGNLISESETRLFGVRVNGGFSDGGWSQTASLTTFSPLSLHFILQVQFLFARKVIGIVEYFQTTPFVPNN